jgi:hypothetical protein
MLQSKQPVGGYPTMDDILKLVSTAVDIVRYDENDENSKRLANYLYNTSVEVVSPRISIPFYKENAYTYYSVTIFTAAQVFLRSSGSVDPGMRGFLVLEFLENSCM